MIHGKCLNSYVGVLQGIWKQIQEIEFLMAQLQHVLILFIKFTVTYAMYNGKYNLQNSYNRLVA